MLKCSGCGLRIQSHDETTGFCSNCGKKLVAMSEASSSSESRKGTSISENSNPPRRNVSEIARSMVAADFFGSQDTSEITESNDGEPDSDKNLNAQGYEPRNEGTSGPVRNDGELETTTDEESKALQESVNSGWGDNVEQTYVCPDMTMTIKGAEDSSDGYSSQSLVIKTRLLVESGTSVAVKHGEDEPEYELLRVLGEGGMGIVYDARQTSIDRNVAVKMIKGDAAADEKQNAKFLAEAVVTGELDHPNIVPIYDVGSNFRGQLFYSMKKVQGTPWLRVIAKNSLAENLDILMRTADAIGFAHARGIVHRDIKPENIMLGEFGEVLVMDWGLAYPLSGFRKSHSVTSAKSLGGTPAYMAPEMATGPIEKIGPASDIYLLGAILYEIVTGHAPHAGKTAMLCLMAAARNEIVQTNKTGELVEIALKAMSTEVDRRYPSVKELQSAIREYQSHLESVLLSTRAEDDLKEANLTDDYQKYSRALFAFQEAHELWSGNKRVAVGISNAKRHYAESAKRKGDFDLGLSLLDESDPEHARLRRELLEARNERMARQKRLDFLKRSALALAFAVMIIVTGASAWIRNEQQKALAEAERATKAEQVALSEKAKAEVSAEKEKTAKIAAMAAEQDAIAQKTKAEEAQKLEEQAKNAAISAEAVAVEERKKAESAKEKEEYESYISKIGLVASQIDKNAFDVARTLLNTCMPELRNWEWGRLMHLCSQSMRSFDAKAPIEALAIDLEGKRFATGGWDGTAMIWDRESGKILVSLKHEGEYVNAVTFSPDGRYLATGSNDVSGYIQIWEIASGQRVSVIKGHDDEVLSLTYSKDGSRLLSSSYDKTARLWDVASGREIRKFTGHTWWVWSAAFSSDERRIITAAHDGTSIVWDVASDKRSPAFTGHHGPVFSAVFSPDGQRAVTAGYDRRVLAWNPDDVKPFDLKRLADGTSDSSTNFRAFDGHTDAVRSIRFSADGTLLLSASFDNTVRVWVFETSQALKTFRGHGGRVKSAVFLPEGREILSAAHDNTVREWSISDYEEIRTLHGRSLEGHYDAVLAATFSRDQQQIVTASRDRTARTWNAKTGAPGLTLSEGHAYLASSAIFFPGGRRLLTAAVDNTARIWDVGTGGQLMRLDRSGRSAAVALSHDTKWIATGGDDKSAQLWEVSTGIRVSKFEAHNVEVTSVAFSPDDRILATGDARGHAKLWSIDGGRILAKLEGHTRRIASIIFLADGSRVLTASGDNTVSQWDVASGQERSNLILKHPDAVLTMQSIPGGNLVVTSCGDRKLRVWNVDEAKVIKTLGPFESDIFSVSVSVDGKRLLAANAEERTVRLWELESGREVQSPQQGGALGPIVDLRRRGGLLWSTAFLPGTDDVLTVGGSDVRLWDVKTNRERMSFSPHGAVASANFSPNGELIVTGSWDNMAKIWDAKTGRVVHKLENGHTSFVNTAIFSPDGKLVLTASDDSTAKLWNVETGEVVRTFEGHSDRVRAAAFSPNGKFVATSSSDKTARLWNAESGKFVREFKGHEWSVVCLDFSKDGRQIVTGSEDNIARVWNIETSENVLTLLGHTASVTSVGFSPDMMRIVTGSQDQAAKLWDAKTGKEILTLSRHTEEVTSVAFSPDGRQVLTASRDGTAVIWLSKDWTDKDAVAAGNKVMPEKQ